MNSKVIALGGVYKGGDNYQIAIDNFIGETVSYADPKEMERYELTKGYVDYFRHNGAEKLALYIMYWVAHVGHWNDILADAEGIRKHDRSKQ
jgi:hypothetical protein